MKGSLDEVDLSPRELTRVLNVKRRRLPVKFSKEEEMSQDEEIQKLRQLGMFELRLEERKKIIDTLAAYGEAGVTPILDILTYDYRTEVREHGLNKIMEIRQKK